MKKLKELSFIKKLIIALVIAYILDIVQGLFKMGETPFSWVNFVAPFIGLVDCYKDEAFALGFSVIKFIGLFVVTYKFLHMLTNGNKIIKLPGTIAISLSGFALKDFMTFMISIQAICLLVDYIIRPKVKGKETHKKIAFVGILLISVVCMFLSCIPYDGAVVSFRTINVAGIITTFYILVPLIIWILIKNKGNYKLSNMFIGIAIFIVVTILAGLLAFYCFGSFSSGLGKQKLTFDVANDNINWINKDHHDNGLTYLYGFMYNFIKPFVNIENFDFNPAFAIVGVFPIPLVIGLWYLFKNDKHYEFMFPVVISMVLITLFIIMGTKLPSVISIVFLLNYTRVEYLIFAAGLLGLLMIFYLMSNDDKNLFTLQASIWIAMACLIVTIFVPLPTAIADKNWRTLFCIPYIILAFLMLNYNKEKKYQRWFIWNLAIITILETSIYMISGS